MLPDVMISCPAVTVGSGLDVDLGAVAVGVAVVVETGDGDSPAAFAGGAWLVDVADGAGVGGVDGGSFGYGEVGGGVVVVAASNLIERDGFDGKGEGVQPVGGDRTLGEAEGPVVGDPAFDGGDVLGGVVVAAQRGFEVGRVGVVAGAGETEVGDGGEGGVEHVLRVGRAVVVAVLSEGTPRSGEELCGPDRPVPRRVAVEEATVGVGDDGGAGS